MRSTDIPYRERLKNNAPNISLQVKATLCNNSVRVFVLRNLGYASLRQGAGGGRVEGWGGEGTLYYECRLLL